VLPRVTGDATRRIQARRDDVPFAARTDPPLTTVSQPTEEEGRLAARALLDALESGSPQEPKRTVLPAELVVRG
jgi:DNA-binding LacI/PurR family transcriptional regulator